MPLCGMAQTARKAAGRYGALVIAPVDFRFLLMLALFLSLAAPAGQAQAQDCDLDPSREGVVVRVIDAETVALEEGEIVRLTGASATGTSVGWRRYSWRKARASPGCRGAWSMPASRAGIFSHSNI